MKIALCTFVIGIFLVNFATPENACAKSAILELAGDATITGLFNIHKGPNCSEGDPTGLQQMAAAAWIVNTLNQNNFLPGIKIGIDLYDACTTDLDELMKSFTNENCKKSYNLGLLTIPELEQNLLSASNANDTLIFFTDSQSPKQLLIDTTVNVLVSLNWTKVDYLFAPSEAFLYTFNKRSYHNGICIVKQHVLPDFQNVHWKHLLHRAVLMERNNTLIVLFGTWEQMLSVVEALAVLNSSIQWILVPFDTMTQRSDIENAPRNSLVVLPAIGILQEKKIHEDMNLAHDHQMYNATGQSEKRIFINYPLFMNVAFPVLNILTKFKAAVSEYCTPDSADYICSTLSSVYFNYSSEPPKRDFIMKMILSSDYIIVTAISHIGENNNLEDFAIYEESPEHEETPIKVVSENYNDVFQGDFCNIAGNNSSLLNDCSYCSNFAGEQVVIGDKMGNFDQVYQLMSWRPEAWVAAVTSIGAVGITCALAITIFISVRICKGDILEGNPFFSYLLLLSVIFTYLSTLPFSFKYDDHDEYLSNLFCALRITGTSMSYAFLFSIMLSRSLMLASFDNDGPFMSHINGFMQSILCIFILGVQIALSVQFLIIRTNFLNAEKCTSMYEGYNFQILLCYDVFLLLLLVCTSPFSVRSKRNYSEGMFFTVASFMCMLIWISWTAAYLILPREWKDVAISGGLAATATGILVTVFIPRTYLMMTAIVRDNLTSALPSLACTNSTSILDLNYRTTSNQVLYDCVNPFPGGQLNPNFYSEQPQAISIVKPEDIDPITPEGTYEMYDSPTSPNKVTHF